MKMRWAGAIAAMMVGTVTAAAAQTPDFSGVWQVTDAVQELKTADGKSPPLKPAAAKIYERNKRKWRAGDLSYDPTAKCVSPGAPRILYLPYPFEIIQGPQRIAYLFQWNYWNRHVDLRGKPLEVPYPLSLGVSVGHWEGDTLLIDTIGLRADNTLLDAAGMPHSEDLHLMERLRLTDSGQILEERITLDDPQTFTRSWDTVVRFRKLPAGTEIREDVCLDRMAAGAPAVVWPGQSRKAPVGK